MNCTNNEKYIIVLKGAANTGKTTTIRYLYNMIRDMYHDIGLTIYHERSDGEICAKLSIKHNTIGIVSLGDRSVDVEKYIGHAVDDCCNVIICTARTSGATPDAIKRKGQNYNIIWRNQSCVTEVAWQARSNKSMSVMLLHDMLLLITR